MGGGNWEHAHGGTACAQGDDTRRGWWCAIDFWRGGGWWLKGKSVDG